MKHTALFILLIFFGPIAAAQKLKPWFLEAGLRSGGNEEVPIKVPTFSLGVGTKLDKYFSLCAAYTFYRSKSSTPTPSPAQIPTHTVDLSTNFHFYNVIKSSKGLYLGLGIAIQFRNGPLYKSGSSYRTITSNAGYSFPIMMKSKQRSLSIDIKSFGPFGHSYSYNSIDFDEILTQFFFGVRLRY